jgi:hypothetical protein
VVLVAAGARRLGSILKHSVDSLFVSIVKVTVKKRMNIKKCFVNGPLLLSSWDVVLFYEVVTRMSKQPYLEVFERCGIGLRGRRNRSFVSNVAHYSPKENCESAASMKFVIEGRTVH